MKFLKKQELRCSLSKLVERLKKDKKLMILLAVSIVVMIGLAISEMTDKTENTVKTDSEAVHSYEKELEVRLSELISAIDGAGDTKVMVTLENGEENVYARNSQAESDGGEVLRTQSGQEYVIIKSGSDETGLHLKTVYPEISGVAVVCHGAESAPVRQRIISTVTAVLGISTAKISVVKMKTEGI